MSKITDDCIGEYIHVSKMIYPNSAMYYKDKDFIKQDNIESVASFIEYIFNALKLNKDEIYDYIYNNENSIEEVIIDENGIKRFTLKLKD
ncbi:MAG: hypothetical protein ACPG9K_01050 [Poseidonibacter sp.]